MKKITLLLVFLITTFGFAQTDSNYCSTDVFHLGLPVETASVIKLTIVNTGANTMKVTVADPEIDLLLLEVHKVCRL